MDFFSCCFWRKFKGLKAQANINNKIVDDLRIQIETGETEDDKWTRIKEEEAQAEKDSVDYYNKERRLMLEFEREADVNARDEDAAFWRKEQEKTRAAEKADMEASAKFWLEYRKTAAKLKADTTPSNLNFGLL